MLNKTIIIYLFLFGLIIFRLKSYCSDDLYSCSDKAATQRRHEYTFSYEDDGRLYRQLSDSGGNNKSNFNILSAGFSETMEHVRKETAALSRKNFPSPHSELLLGMTIGVDNFDKVTQFKEMLRRTGTIHVVVVSGFNISLVYNFVIKIIGNPYRPANLLLALSATFLYALLSGFNPPVFRAWVMGSIISLGKYYGRNSDIFLVLILSAGFMLTYDPSYLFSMSFQLSFMATLGLVMFSEPVKKLLCKVGRSNVIMEDLTATLSAQLLVWPIIAYNFSTFSIVSFVLNALTLWIVPFITVWGMLFMLLAGVNSLFADILSLVLYYPMEFFINMVELFSRLPFAEVNLHINNIFILFYYLLIFIVWKGGKPG